MEKTKKPPKKSKNTKIDRKSQINNEIIHAQGKFKQAKIGTIRKLVKKLKQPDKNPKQNRANKAERYQNVLNQIKHMSPKRLGLLALLYYKSGKSYLADQNSTIEQLTVGYYSESKGLNVLLDSIRSKLKLTENSNWRKSVKKLFKKKDKSKKPEKVEKETSFTESNNTNAKTEPKIKNKKSKKEVESKGKVEKSDKSSKTQQKKQIDAEEQDEETSNDTDESSETDEDDNDEELDSGNAVTAPTTVDDFFITADGSNYLSTAVVSRKQEEDSDDASTGNMQRGKGFEKKPRESSFFHKSDKKPVKLAANRFEGSKRKWSDEAGEIVPKEKQTKLDPELHPSWQAKQKLKPTITEFKGKKITFD